MVSYKISPYYFCLYIAKFFHVNAAYMYFLLLSALIKKCPGCFRKTANQKLIKIVENNEKISDSKHIADAFNNYFANVGKELEKEIPLVNNSPIDYLPSLISKSFYIFTNTSYEIED